ncbi:hypothetical protein JCGZ_06530 [Jatropha curcas]|uniref:Uncharacterized protein n=1 Tax=Jatropha curcas TaxID=180498 RepID=A0A067LEE9_JATCU|nr:hypothetical protein JCGZ_06530 [Jatropha curcas]
MEKDRSSEKMKTHHLCISTKLRSSKSKNCLSPMTLLQRFHKAVFRLMMVSALSKVNSSSSNNNSNSKIDCGSPVMKRYYYSADHHSEAVADCIEFIKKTTVAEEESGGRSSTAPELVMPAVSVT